MKCAAFTLALALSGAACSSLNTRLEESRKNLASLGETTAAIADNWLNGRVSTTYSAAALETTFQLVESERATLASDPKALQDPQGIELAQKQERLSRLVAAMIVDVRGGDGDAARRRMADIPIRSADK
jgi:hypothetical protein